LREHLPPAGEPVGHADPVELEREAVAAEARSPHALDGEKGIGLEIGRLAEEEEVEVERVAGREVAGLGRGLEDVRTGRGGKAAQKGRRFVLDQGLEETGVDTGAPQPAGRAGLLGTHGADGGAQGMTEGTAQREPL